MNQPNKAEATAEKPRVDHHAENGINPRLPQLMRLGRIDADRIDAGRIRPGRAPARPGPDHL